MGISWSATCHLEKQIKQKKNQKKTEKGQTMGWSKSVLISHMSKHPETMMKSIENFTQPLLKSILNF